MANNVCCLFRAIMFAPAAAGHDDNGKNEYLYKEDNIIIVREEGLDCKKELLSLNPSLIYFSHTFRLFFIHPSKSVSVAG